METHESGNRPALGEAPEELPDFLARKDCLGHLDWWLERQPAR